MIDRLTRQQVMLRFRFARHIHSSEGENEEVDDEQDVDLAYTPLDCWYVVSLQCFVQSSSSESSVLTVVVVVVIIIFTITAESLLPRVPYYSRNRRGT